MKSFGLIVCLLVSLTSVSAMARGGHKSRLCKTPIASSASSLPLPTGLTAAEMGRGQVSLQWDSVAGATSYWVYRDGCAYTIVFGFNYYLDPSAGAGVTHTYGIAAVINSTLGPAALVTITTSP